MKSNTLLFRFLRSYLLVLLVTAVIFSLAYLGLYRTVRDQEVLNSVRVLQHASSLIEARIREVNNVAMQLALDARVARIELQELPFKQGEYYRLIELRDSFPAFVTTNDFIAKVFVVFRGARAVVTDDNASLDLESYYGQFLGYEGMDASVWVDTVTTLYHNREIWPAKELRPQAQSAASRLPAGRYLTFLQSVPPGHSGRVAGAVVALVSENVIGSYFRPLTEGYLARCSIVDTLGAPIALGEANVPASRIPEDAGRAESGYRNGPRESVTWAASRETGWFYVARIPTTVFADRVAPIRRLYIAITVGTVLLGFGISLWRAQKDALPMRRLLSRLPGPGGSADSTGSPYDFIAGTMNRFVRDNASLQSLVEGQRPLLVETFYERLLRGQFYDPSDIALSLSLSGIGLPDGPFAVALLRIRGVSAAPSSDAIAQLEAARLACRQVVAEACPHCIHVHSMDHDKLAAVFGGAGRGDVVELLAVEATTAAGHLRERYRISVQVGVGRAQSRLIDLGSSCREAESALESPDSSSSDVLVPYDAGRRRNANCFYPLDVEARLYNLVRLGKASEAEIVWAEVFARNFGDTTLSERERRELATEVSGTLRKCEAELPGMDERTRATLGDQVSAVRRAPAAADLDQAVRVSIRGLCSAVQDRRHGRADRLKDEILAYIGEHYMDWDLGLYRVASHFRLTEKYLSDFFKDRTGTNFLAYVQGFRMTRAKELIADRDLPIHDVARMVGYTTNSAFARAFKRFHGVSPSSLRARAAS
jgi:two-component system, response regulator YesN